MNKTKGWILFAAALISCGFIAAAIAVGPQDAANAQIEVVVPVEEQAAVQPESPQWRYLVKAFGGQVAVYEQGQPASPKYVTGIQVQSLPKVDREKLEQGIPIYTDPELTKILEDFGS